MKRLISVTIIILMVFCAVSVNAEVKTADIVIKGTPMEMSFSEMEQVRDQINHALGEGKFFHDFGDSETFLEFAEKRGYPKAIENFGNSDTLMEFLEK